MNKQHLILMTVLVTGITLSSPALSEETQQPSRTDKSATSTSPTNMPMMGGQQGHMMNPMMRQRMMQMHQQGAGMPMSGSQGYMMNPQMREQMMRMHQQGNMPMSRGPGNMTGPRGRMGMMQGGQQSMPPMMNMMQQRHAEMSAHRQAMEKRLANIEALLQELVNLQKGK